MEPTRPAAAKRVCDTIEELAGRLISRPLGAGQVPPEGDPLEASPSSPAETPGIRLIEVVAEASTIEGWRKVVRAGQTGSGTFSFVSDEGSYMPGGHGTAPSPLTYFTAGVAL
jgi:hypothetical protein